MSNLQSEFWKQAKNQTYINNWTDIPRYMVNSDLGYCLIPLQNIPIQRSEKFTIAALSPRTEESFYLVDSSPIKNIAFYPKNHSIFCSDEYGKLLLTHFNNGIRIESIDKKHLSLKIMEEEKASILEGQFFIQKLSNREFVPPTSSGILAAVCYTEDLDNRKWLYQRHCILTKDIANIERSILDLCLKSEIDLLAVNAQKDSKGHFHTFATIKKENEVIFEQYSQSTTYNFAQNFINKI